MEKNSAYLLQEILGMFLKISYKILVISNYENYARWKKYFRPCFILSNFIK